MLGAMGNDAAGVEASAVNEKLLSDERDSTQIGGQELIRGEQAGANELSSSGPSNPAAFASGTMRSSLQEDVVGQERSLPQRPFAMLPAISCAEQPSDPLPSANTDPATSPLSGRAAESQEPRQSSRQPSEPGDKKLANLDALSQAAVTAFATPAPLMPPGVAELAARAGTTGTIGSTASGSAIQAFPPQHVASALTAHAGPAAPALPRSPMSNPNRESAIAPEGMGVDSSIAVDGAAVEEPIAAQSEPAPKGLAEMQPENSFSSARLTTQSGSSPVTTTNPQNNLAPGDLLREADAAQPISAPAAAGSEQDGTAQPADWRTTSRAMRGSSAVEPMSTAPQASATGATPHANHVQISDQASGISINDPAANSIGSAATPAPRDPFAALDAPASAAPTWVHAGAQRAEAGFEDPALGWVGVRAGLGEGGVHAALVPASPDAAASLGTHLAGLSAYLAQHHTEVSDVTLATPESRALGSGFGPGAQHAPGRGSGDGAQAGAEHNANQDSTLAATTNGLRTAAAQAETASQQVEAVSGLIAPTAGMAGTRISVMA
jgi:hypothetical protein